MTIPDIKPYKISAENFNFIPRVNWTVDCNKSLLLVHDMQDYFLNFYDLEQPPIPDLIRNIKNLLNFAREKNIPIVYTMQPDKQTLEERGVLQEFWGPGINNASHLKSIFNEISPKTDDIVLTKWRYSAFKKTELQKVLHKTNRRQLLICGIYAHIGCLLTASEAFMLDFEPFLVYDAVADFSENKHNMAIEYTSSCCGVTVSTKDILKTK